MMTGIAISYRREDTAWIAGRIFDRLKDHYETPGTRGDGDNSVVLFMDYDSTPIGADFRKYIKGVLDECSILLAVIGARWIGDDGKGELRIMREGDWVRIEIETALANHIPVVPILIDRTPMPTADLLPEEIRELVYRQAAVIDTQLDFNSHVDRLIREIDRLLGIAPLRRDARRNRQVLGLIGGGLVALAVGSAATVYFFPSHKSVTPDRNNVEANCGGVAIGGNARDSTITAGTATNADCSRRAK
jgi:TIR domain